MEFKADKASFELQLIEYLIRSFPHSLYFSFRVEIVMADLTGWDTQVTVTQGK